LERAFRCVARGERDGPAKKLIHGYAEVWFRMADRYRTPVPVLKGMMSMRDVQDFMRWEAENPSELWWTEMAARAQGVKFERTLQINTADDDSYVWQMLTKQAKGKKP
jgi:hypothetical protein